LRGDDGGDGLLARVEAGGTDREIRDAAYGQAIGVELVNRDAVRAALTDEETTVDAIQRPDLVSILAGGRRTAVDDAADEGRVVPGVLGTEHIARRQAGDLSLSECAARESEQERARKDSRCLHGGPRKEGCTNL
jgi:hypothetical protein